MGIDFSILCESRSIVFFVANAAVAFYYKKVYEVSDDLYSP